MRFRKSKGSYVVLNGFSAHKLYLDMRGQVTWLVEGRVSRGGTVTVNRFGNVWFAETDGAAENGVPVAEHAGRLRNYLYEQGFKAKKAVLCLGRPGMVVRSVKVPQMSLPDLKSHMELEIKDYLPVNEEDFAFDFKVINAFEEDGREYFNLMAAAVLKKHIDESVGIIELAGLEPLIVDIFPSVVWNLLANKHLDIAVVDAGRDGTRLVLCRGEELVLYADIPFRLAVQQENDISLLVQEISGYLDFFASRNFGKNVDRIYVSGELVLQPEAVAGLKGVLNVPVEPAFYAADAFEIKANQEEFKSVASVYAGNIGLMLREV